MAEVDFSHAIFDVYGNSKPMTDGYLRLTTNNNFVDSNVNRINTGKTITVLTNTPTKVSILYTGSFTASGIEFWMADMYWKVSNISFSSGDTYSFIIDIEVEGNT